jgi:hypothetical protein
VRSRDVTDYKIDYTQKPTLSGIPPSGKVGLHRPGADHNIDYNPNLKFVFCSRGAS